VVDQLLAERGAPPRVVGVFTDAGEAALPEWGADGWDSRGEIGVASWGQGRLIRT
jgi:hypothetical protein